MMDSPHTDPELSQWLCRAAEGGSTPTFVRTVSEAALMACSPDYAMLRPVLVELKRRYPAGLTHQQTILQVRTGQRILGAKTGQFITIPA
jgi:hypothetical protein